MSPTLLDVDPSTLVLGDNARLHPSADKEFVASVRERGVIEPVIAYRLEGGDLIVVHGARRTLAAVAAKRPTVPVMLVEAPKPADRLVDQLVENDHREALTAADRATAYQQLAACGLSAATIAKRTATKRPVVDAGLAVAASPAATSAVAEHGLTLTQAAVVAEFGDDEAAVRKLVEAARTGGFDHVAERVRDNAQRDAAEATAAAELAAAGVPVVDAPAWDATSPVRLDHLLDDAGEGLTAEGHAGCPGHAAFVRADWDWDEDSDRSTLVVETEFVCTDPDTHGHKRRHGGSGAGRGSAAEPSEQDRARASTERREVIANNKAWDSATTVRRRWLREFLSRRTAPKGAALFIADAIARGGGQLHAALGYDLHPLAHELLGVTRDGYGNADALTGLLAGATDSRAQLLTVALILCAYEAATGRDSWRRQSEDTARYLRYLQALGYELADVELLACGGPA
ncbi:MAG TPA: ParB N-terminal domain-containing protein [Pseudonocardiaceae bacterium]|nr:ParB N-terminal domain-containing protein [Pseudonocardiaceae bacterium]